ncbi:tetratricopeptide repeat protein [Archangium lansingense]|uniref:Serine/threonine-protein kinase n=1 Tax=Archangium lansingense TaxID=2995310 RepID=A0ABT4AAU2_9BACT|nr:serine/threonine-protein kinase [Archangium lansinium]MCY1078798.1 serine/threonine-protein kinase [Archangium lansinium]
MADTLDSSRCLQENTLLALSQGALSSDERRRADAHLDTCESCRAVLAALGHALPDEAAPPMSPPGGGPSRDTGLSPGSSLGRFVMLHRVGSGGMGDVYAAYDSRLDRRVALKLLRSELAARPEAHAEARLLREAQALARLTHPHVITVYDAGLLDGKVFIAMEFVDGGTLAGWLREKPRSLEEVLESFLAAGRGLAAAHAAGLVHRDFKPDNVLIGRDGRVRVTDFGLARGGPDSAVRTPVALPEGATPADSGRLTRVGMVVGTPAYMAPEQHQGQAVDARGDQFSFCVALHEALAGELPFEGPAGGGPPRPLPRERQVPERVRRALARGLSPQPEQRFPSMEALLAELEHARRGAGRERWLLAAGVAVALLLTAGGVVVRERGAQVCRGAGQRLEGIWDSGRRERMRSAFLATGVPYAEQAWRSTSALLEGYTAGWVRMHTEACEATRVRGEQSAELMDLRMECLGQRLATLRELTEVLVAADARVVERSAQAVSGLPDLEGCASVVGLSSPVPPPADAGARARIASLRADVAWARARFDAGRYGPGRERMVRAAEAARELGWRPLEAEVLHLLGQLEYAADDGKAAVQSLHRALWAAQAGRDDAAAARVSVELVRVSGTQMMRQHAQARQWAGLATALLERTGGSRSWEAALELASGQVEFDEGQLGAALSHYERALALREALLGPESLAVAEVLTSMSNVHIMRDEAEKAREHLGRALAVREKLLGPEHPLVALTRRGLGFTWFIEHKAQQAEQEMRRALEIDERALGPKHLRLASDLDALATVLRQQGRAREAIPLYDRALSISESSVGADAPVVGSTLINRAGAFAECGEYARAIEDYQRTLALHEKTLGPEHPDLAMPLSGMGEAQLLLNQPARARASLERALRLEEKSESRRLYGEIGYHLGEALWRLGERRRARELILQLRQTATRKEPYQEEHESVEALDAWLAAHPL